MRQENKSDSIYEQLKKRIYAGEFDEDQILPTEKVLEKAYNASRNTVRKAIRKLNSEGIIYSKPGSSNVVLKRIKVDDLLIDSGNINRPSILKDSSVETKVVSFERGKVDRLMAEKTTFPENDYYFHVVRLRIVDGKALMLDDSLFLAQVLPDLTADIAKGSIYQFIQHNYDRRIVGSKLVDRIILAGEMDKTYLQLNELNAVGLTQNWSYLDTGEIFEYTEIHFLPEAYVRTRFVSQKER